jgi:hypothetical protein
VSEFSEWWYPYEFRIGAAYAAEDGQVAFTPVSSPNSDWYGSASGIWITNVSHSDSVMTFDLGFGNAWPAILQHWPVALDTSLIAGSSLQFSAAATDENGDATTYDWYLGGGLVQSSADSTYQHVAGAAGTSDTLAVVATDGALADTLVWNLTNEPGTSVAAGLPAVDRLFLALAPVPFRSSVTVRYDVPAAGATSLAVHDLAGRIVAILREGEHPAGSFVSRWDGRNESGERVAAGVYFVRITSGSDTLTRKAVLLR